MNKNNRKITTKNSKIILKSVKNVLNSKSETKISDILYSNTLGASTYVYDLLQISQGTSNVNNRVGLSVNPFQYNLRMQLYVSYALTGQQFNNIRVIVIKDLQQKDSTIPVITDYLSTSAVVAQNNYFNLKRFKVYYDKVHTLSYYEPSKFLDLDLSLKGEVRYSGVSSSTINKNGLYLILLDDNTANPTTFNFWGRVSFKDM